MTGFRDSGGRALLAGSDGKRCISGRLKPAAHVNKTQKGLPQRGQSLFLCPQPHSVLIASSASMPQGGKAEDQVEQQPDHDDGDHRPEKPESPACQKDRRQEERGEQDPGDERWEVPQ